MQTFALSSANVPMLFDNLSVLFSYLNDKFYDMGYYWQNENYRLQPFETSFVHYGKS